MNRFQIPSPILDLKTNNVNGFILEYVTTIIPFETLTTTEQVPEAETSEHSGLMMIIYGIGGLLIFLVIWTCCYLCFMPDISDAEYARFLRRHRENLEERGRHERLERERNGNDVEEPEYIYPPGHIFARLNRNEDDRRERDLQRIEEGRTSGLLGNLGQAIRSHTSPKQLCESHQETRRYIEPRNTTVTEERRELSQFPISDKYEERVPSWEYFPDNFIPAIETRQLSQETMLIDQCEKGNSSFANLQNSDTSSPDYKGRSQSFPTSPNTVRRRYPSQEDTPRRSHSMR